MAKKRPIQPTDFYLIKQVVDPNVSPDGRLVAYTQVSSDKAEDETRTAVYVAPVDGNSPARRFTHGKKDHSPRWSPDGKYLAFVSDRGEKNQLFIAPLDGGEARQVTTSKWGVSSPAWSPDGKRVAYAERTGEWKERKDKKGAEKNEPRVIRNLRYKLDGIGFFDERRMHIFVSDVESGATRQVTDGDYYCEQPAWSPDGRQIAFVSDREKDRHQRQFRADIWVAPAAGGKPRRVSRARGGASSPAFSPNGKWIAFVGHENGDGGSAKNAHLYVVPADGGPPRSIGDALDRPAAGWFPAAGKTLAWAPDSKSVLFLVSDHGTQAIYRGNVGGDAALVVDGERQIEAFAQTPDGQRLVFTAAWPSMPWEVYSAAAGNGAREVNLSRANADAVGHLEFADLTRMSYRAADGLEIEAFVIYPKGYKLGRRYPLAIDVHGGPHSFHPGSRAMIEQQSLAARGYVVLLPNPRGSATYGEAFSTACVHDWGGADFGDILAGADVLIEQGVVDPARQYIGGYSYGGFMASWAVGHTDRFRAAMVGAPVSNQTSMFGTGDIPLFDVHEIGGLPQENVLGYIERSPVTHLKNCQTPVLLIHHEGDLRCPIAQSEEIFHALKAMRKEVEFVRYPGGFHTWNTHAPSQTVDRIGRVIAWYDGHPPFVKKPRGRRAAVRKRAPATRS